MLIPGQVSLRTQKVRCDFKHHDLQVVGTQRYWSLVINKSSWIPMLILCTAAGVPLPWGSPLESSAVSGMYSGLKDTSCPKSWSHISAHARACLQCLQQPPVPFFWEMCTFSRELWAEFRLGPPLVFLCLFIQSLIQFPNPTLKGRQLFPAQRLWLIKTTSIKHPNPGRECKKVSA